MKVSIQWLSKHIDLDDLSLDQLYDLFTFSGIEVEEMHEVPDQLIVCKIISSERHPNADRLSICKVDDGTHNIRQIVCGAKNYKIGDNVPLALPGCILKSKNNESFEIRNSKLRGENSFGMLCSSNEIGLDAEEESTGLLILDSNLIPGTSLKDIFPTTFTVEITPNRPDCLSHFGIARELSALIKRPIKEDYSYLNPNTIGSTNDQIINESSDKCPLYLSRIIKGVTIQDSPKWLKEKLLSIGLNPINNVVDIINYILMDIGQPLHAFDYNCINGPIKIREANNGEKFCSINNNTYTLSSDDLVIADDKEIIALAGIMGGKSSQVTNSTTNILIESAYFSPSQVRKTSHKINLKSDSSYRFERSVDPQFVVKAIDLATQKILEIAGGTASKSIIKTGEIPKVENTIEISQSYVKQVIGINIPEEVINKTLSSLGLLSKKNNKWEVPSFRSKDLKRPIDLVEEITRIYGFDKIESSKGNNISFKSSKVDNFYDFTFRLKEKLSTLGFLETLNLKLISEEKCQNDIISSYKKMDAIILKNPLNDEQSVLRPSLVPGLISTAQRNINFGNTNLRLFEIGRVFNKNKKSQEIESDHISVLLTGNSSPINWDSNNQKLSDIHDLREVIEIICYNKITLTPLEYDDLFCASIVEIVSGKNKIKLGVAGVFPPEKSRKIGSSSPILIVELDLKKIYSEYNKTKKIKFKDISKFPSISRDIAIVAPKDLPSQTVLSFFESYNEPLLKDINLFDVFYDKSGEKLSKEKKSLAYSITYRSDDRTLETLEIENIHKKLLNDLKENLKVEFR